MSQSVFLVFLYLSYRQIINLPCVCVCECYVHNPKSQHWRLYKSNWFWMKQKMQNIYISSFDISRVALRDETMIGQIHNDDVDLLMLVFIKKTRLRNGAAEKLPYSWHLSFCHFHLWCLATVLGCMDLTSVRLYEELTISITGLIFSFWEFRSMIKTKHKDLLKI